MAAKDIVIVDDDQWFADSLQATLRRHGYVARLAHNALEAIERINEQLPMVIVADFFMPGPNAMVLLHELQSYSDTADIPVVLCTNSAADIALDLVEPYGVKVVLDKTLMQPDDIVAAVRRVT